MRKNFSFKIPNPIFWLYSFIFWICKFIYRFHKCEFEIELYDIPMENTTNFLITQCRCGKTKMDRAHRESVMYKNWNKNNK